MLQISWDVLILKKEREQRPFYLQFGFSWVSCTASCYVWPLYSPGYLGLFSVDGNSCP